MPKNLKDRKIAINQINQLSKLMKKACLKCNEIKNIPKYRCCDSFFCEATERSFKKLGVHYEKTDNPNIPFMGENGCIVSPEHRPLCTMFACPKVKEDRKFRREYIRLEIKIKKSSYFLDTVDSEQEMMKAFEKL